MDLENIEQQADYWNGRWANKETGWHLPAPHDVLVKHIELIAPAPERDPEGQARCIFLPLCGKTRDIDWLHQQGYRVAACELNESAVREIFAEMGEVPHIGHETLASGKSVRVFTGCGGQVRVFCCNIFDLDPSFADVDAVFDRAALGALPPKTREAYVRLILEITHRAPQLLVVFQHTRSTAPPHSITHDLVTEYYGRDFITTRLSQEFVGDKIEEVSYLLLARTA